MQPRTRSLSPMRLIEENNLIIVWLFVRLASVTFSTASFRINTEALLRPGGSISRILSTHAPKQLDSISIRNRYSPLGRIDIIIPKAVSWIAYWRRQTYTKAISLILTPGYCIPSERNCIACQCSVVNRRGESWRRASAAACRCRKLAISICRTCKNLNQRRNCPCISVNIQGVPVDT